MNQLFSKYGARPSPAAATDVNLIALEIDQPFGGGHVAAPEDGRAPTASFHLNLSFHRFEHRQTFCALLFVQNDALRIV
jgi:hypothetical protein